MTFQENMTEQLDEVLGIKPVVSEEESPKKELVPVSDKQIAKKFDDYELEVKKNIHSLEELQKSGVEAYKDLVEICKNFNKDRSYEVMASVMNSITATIKARHDLVRDLHGFNDPPEQAPNPNQPQNLTQNNVIFAGSFKELLASIPEQRIVVVSDSNVKEEVKLTRYELNIKKEDEVKIKEFTEFKYEIESKDDITTLIFDNAPEMNRFKYTITDKYGKDFNFL